MTGKGKEKRGDVDDGKRRDVDDGIFRLRRARVRADFFACGGPARIHTMVASARRPQIKSFIRHSREAKSNRLTELYVLLPA